MSNNLTLANVSIIIIEYLLKFNQEIVMSSTLKKERIIYFTGLALFVLLAITLCFPYVVLGVYTDNQSATVAESVTYLGWQFFGLKAFYKSAPVNGVTETGSSVTTTSVTFRNVTPVGSEAALVIFNYAILLLAVAIAVYDGFALFESYVHKKSFGKKFINIMHVSFFIATVATVLFYVPYINHLNSYVFTSKNAATVASEARSWASFAFKSLTGVESQMKAAPFLIAIFGFASLMISLICTMKLQDNSILYPYKKRHVYAALLCMAMCVGVFFLPCIDYYYSTYYICKDGVANSPNTLQGLLYLAKDIDLNTEVDTNALELIAKNFSTGVGWDCFLAGSGDIAGFYKVIFILMFAVAGCGFMFGVATLLAAVGIIKFNFDKKYFSLITAIIMGFGILLWVASFVYSISINIRLGEVYIAKGFEPYFRKAYPEGQFPQTVCTVGAWLSMLPGIAAFAGTKALCAYDD